LKKYKGIILLVCLVAGGVVFNYFDVVNINVVANKTVNLVMGILTIILLVGMAFLGFLVRRKMEVKSE
jgi:hypothetical protein